MSSFEFLQQLLGKSLDHPDTFDFQNTLKSSTAGSTARTETKWYPDVVYINHYSCGISLCCSPLNGSKLNKEWTESDVILESIDIYNPLLPLVPTPSTSSTKPVFSPYPSLPLSMTPRFSLTTSSTGKDLVSALQEPSKKGGGVGWVDVWLEWEAIGIQVELRDPKGNEVVTDHDRKKGLGGIWDRAAGWTWGSMKIFEPVKSGQK